ncbi:CBS domain-containing protein [Teredinibacter waterburyi]|jgi:CBS-domain-containing membrane protein|uniref:CBS domain-containing protein n=1 Tax=Teredinibacter waterburyi TaxID=1500538 RepID=UPI00165F6035|nr:CBS domain-containing protein [Teredinibacter waterburyi]
MLVADIMTKNVITVSPDNDLADLRQHFSSKKFHHLLVEDNGKLVGIISDRDASANSSPFLGTLNERPEDRELLDKKVSAMMSTTMVTVVVDTIIDCAAILLLENNISCLPVVDQEMNIKGILTWKDILQFHVYDVDKTLCIPAAN